MGTIDDLPKRHKTHDIADEAEAAFAEAVREHRLFLLQKRNAEDYGTDRQIAALDGGEVTNFRAHVQLKGTETDGNADGSVSVSIKRTTLNYLLQQPHSCFVCYHIPTRRLLVRGAMDVYCTYEHHGEEWTDQNEITIQFSAEFDRPFQQPLHDLLIASGRATRARRLGWSETPPQHASVEGHSVRHVDVPLDANRAREVLRNLYERGDDAAIDAAFDQFAAVLDPVPRAMDQAYLAKVNLASHGGRSHVIESPANPGRFRTVSHDCWSLSDEQG